MSAAGITKEIGEMDTIVEEVKDPEVEPVSTNLFGGSQGGISSTSTVVESF
jgi:hypothetical protein